MLLVALSADVALDLLYQHVLCESATPFFQPGRIRNCDVDIAHTNVRDRQVGPSQRTAAPRRWGHLGCAKKRTPADDVLLVD